MPEAIEFDQLRTDQLQVGDHIPGVGTMTSVQTTPDGEVALTRDLDGDAVLFPPDVPWYGVTRPSPTLSGPPGSAVPQYDTHAVPTHPEGGEDD